MWKDALHRALFWKRLSQEYIPNKHFPLNPYTTVHQVDAGSHLALENANVLKMWKRAGTPQVLKGGRTAVLTDYEGQSCTWTHNFRRFFWSVLPAGKICKTFPLSVRISKMLL